MSNKLRGWRIRHFKRHPFCHWCGCKLVLALDRMGMRQADNEATVDHIRSRLDARRREPLGPGEQEIRRVLACYRCNQARNDEETARKVEECRRRSGHKTGGSVELAKRPYPERKKFLALLAKRIDEGGIPGLVSVMGGKGSAEQRQAKRCRDRKGYHSATEAQNNLRPGFGIYFCPHCNLWHRTTHAALARRGLTPAR